MSVALITGGSAGLGLALLEALAEQGWTVVTDGRDAERLADVSSPGVVRVVGDIVDPAHRAALVAEVERLGRLDLLVHNASTLGPLPLRPLRDLTGDDLVATWAVNAVAPHELTRALLPWLRASSGVLISAVVRCCGRALPDLGGVRGRQGRSRPPHRDLGGRGGAARVRDRSR